MGCALFKYIVVEGLDGSGKSTLSQYISTKYNYFLTREPGGTEIGRELRELLLNNKEHILNSEVQVLLMLADRSAHLEEVVRPALLNNRLIVSDRSYLSSIAYQGYGGGYSIPDIRKLNSLILKNTIPDLVIFIDTPLSICRERTLRERDKFESQDDSYFLKVRDGYLKESILFENKWVTVDGSLSPEELYLKIDQILLP